MKYKKKKRVYILLLILLSITLGYALISTTLKINGIANVSKHTWKVYWQNITNESGEQPVSGPTIGNDENNNANTVITFSVQLNDVGDFYEFYVDAVNEGDLNAKVAGVDLYCDGEKITPSNPLPPYAKLSIKYADDTEVGIGDILAKADSSTTPATPTVKTYKVRIEFTDEDLDKADIDAMDEYENHTFGFGVDYQFTKDDEAPVVRNLALGDYFTMTPDSDSYKVLATDTGASSDVTINPQELNLWRVVNVNQDGTFDAVSEYVSSSKITFKGDAGYKNYVKVLQDIAAQYAKSGYTVGTRAFGYDGQTLVVDDTKYNNAVTTIEPNSYYRTPVLNTGTGQEYDDGALGDNLYLKDTEMVTPFYRTYENYGGAATTKNQPDDYAVYWLASRFLFKWDHGQFHAETSGLVMGDVLLYGRININSGSSAGVRPIITIKSNLNIASGTGNKSDPYVFE